MGMRFQAWLDSLDYRPVSREELDALDPALLGGLDAYLPEACADQIPEGGLVGSLTWWGCQEDDLHPVAHVWVHSAFRRRGLATELWNRARRADPKLAHSLKQTEEGRVWATSLGRAR